MSDEDKGTKSNVVDELNSEANLTNYIKQLSDLGYDITPKSKAPASKVATLEAPSLDLDIEDDAQLTGRDLKKLLNYISQSNVYTQGLVEKGKQEVKGTLDKKSRDDINAQANKLHKRALEAGMSDEDFRKKVYPEIVSLYREGQDLDDVFTKACKIVEVKNPFTGTKETKANETQGGKGKLEDSEKKPAGTVQADSSAPNPRTLDADISGKTTSEIAEAALTKSLAEVGNPTFKADEDKL